MLEGKDNNRQPKIVDLGKKKSDSTILCIIQHNATFLNDGNAIKRLIEAPASIKTNDFISGLY